MTKRRAWLAVPLLGAVVAAALVQRIARGQDDPSTRPDEEVPDDGEQAPPSIDSAASTAEAPPARSEDAMLRVPAGTFRMGSTAPRAQPNESPLHLVKISAFQLDVTEVTVAAYRACVARGGCVAPRMTSSHCTYDRGDGELPVNCVSFAEAEAFCLAHQKRLPTESEWELAARGTGTERAYPWGDDPPSCERAISTRGERTADLCNDGPARVDRRRGRSPYGMADLAGNLEEWVSDFYDDRHPPESGGPAIDPRGVRLGTAHALRGGSWQSPRSGIRTTARSWGSAMERGVTVGFRCARDDR